MERTDLQRLFVRKQGDVSPLEDFTTEALCIAIRRDVLPLALALQRVDPAVWARVRSGRPTIDLAAVTQATADTQHYLYHEGLKGGRLDLLVKLSTADGASETLWIEVKIDAGLTYNDGRTQLEIYLDHRDLENPKPVVLTLARTAPLAPDVAGITWADLVDAVDDTPGVNPWWADVAAFLRAEGAGARPPTDGSIDIEGVMPVFRRTDRAIRTLWLSAPQKLSWGSWLTRVVRSGYLKYGRIWLTGGPLRYGLVPVETGWEWQVAVADGSDWSGIRVDVGEILDAAAGLSGEWTRPGTPDSVVLATRPHVIGAPLGPTADWLSQALGEIEAAGLLEPYFRAYRAKLDAEAQVREAKEKAAEAHGR